MQNVDQQLLFNLTCGLVGKMAPRLSARQSEIIAEAIRNHPHPISVADCQLLADNYNTSLRAISRMKAKIYEGRPVYYRKGGPTRILNWKHEQAICMLLDQEPWSYQDEIADFLLDCFGIDVVKSTVCRALKRLKKSRKKFRVEAAQRNPELRIQWQFDLQSFDAEQIICVDECGSDDRTGDRMYGWADQGVRAVVHRWLAGRNRVSALPAYTVNGYIEVITFPGTCTGEIFE